ncbi:TetR family transcriptional regulator C-terminal domain-containing protein [Paenibacillus sp. DLE-14]|uniref:TetR family transcriptional regulator C-terminal domain-containing protein n=1 Tax=Paenibacillus lignilyticus TaxID=1172615 RepID=A0ABS5CDI4_9BACL|nr:TetR family transcriptional regulator C-terminal domain-containing protein [Paenibacillus lignilyticus]
MLSKLPEERVDLDHSLLQMFLNFEAHFSFYYTVLTHKGISCFREQLIQLVKAGIVERLKASGNIEEGNKEVSVQFLLSAYVGVVEWWILNKMPLSPLHVAGELRDMLDKYDMQPPYAALNRHAAVACDTVGLVIHIFHAHTRAYFG